MADTRQPMPQLDPELGPFLELIPAFEPTLETLPSIRAQAEGTKLGPGQSEVQFERAAVPGRGGEPDVPVLIYNGGGSEARPLLLYLHGGGMILGTADAAGMRATGWADRLGAVVVSVEYRLAPATPFPGPQEDCYSALLWAVANAARLGVDPARILVVGESAGGGLAASLAQMVRDRGELDLAGQALIYPMLDCRTGGPHSPWHNPVAGHWVWTAKANQFGWSCLRGSYTADDARAGWFSPALADDLAGLAPAYIGVGGLDLFVDEDLDYARRLTAAGVPVEMNLYPGAVHGFDLYPLAKVSQRANADILAWLARRLAVEVG